MEIQITENWRVAIKWFSRSKCGSWMHWIIFYRNYNSI